MSLTSSTHCFFAMMTSSLVLGPGWLLELECSFSFFLSLLVFVVAVDAVLVAVDGQ